MILWQYCRNKPAVNDNGNNAKFDADYATNSLKLKKKITGQVNSDGTKSVQLMVLLKHLSNFRRTLEIP